jgi:hypothetical protein
VEVKPQHLCGKQVFSGQAGGENACGTAQGGKRQA